MVCGEKHQDTSGRGKSRVAGLVGHGAIEASRKEVGKESKDVGLDWEVLGKLKTNDKHVAVGWAMGLGVEQQHKALPHKPD